MTPARASTSTQPRYGPAKGGFVDAARPAGSFLGVARCDG